MSNPRPGKRKNTKCVSVSLILCEEPLRKVFGLIGRDKLRLGFDSTSKKKAIYELLDSNPFEPTEEMVKAGMEIVGRKSK